VRECVLLFCIGSGTYCRRAGATRETRLSLAECLPEISGATRKPPLATFQSVSTRVSRPDCCRQIAGIA
jgi:hypothetical protein